MLWCPLFSFWPDDEGVLGRFLSIWVFGGAAREGTRLIFIFSADSYISRPKDGAPSAAQRKYLLRVSSKRLLLFAAHGNVSILPSQPAAVGAAVMLADAQPAQPAIACAANSVHPSTLLSISCSISRGKNSTCRGPVAVRRQSDGCCRLTLTAQGSPTTPNGGDDAFHCAGISKHPNTKEKANASGTLFPHPDVLGPSPRLRGGDTYVVTLTDPACSDSPSHRQSIDF
ncbi:hypothetical protein CKAH01_00588 [Colletotrichum kahawae]|uniref:Uncharacterized protein n=1 Tax=Colletotrichum kahawae TaxID=34407 RepID=A0AAE0D8Q7_COLKA|nr:hypothetical protein CKAH01_00588 [Colletotrichum kahawae]